MRARVDSDVLLDVALARAPFSSDSAAVLRWAEAGGEAAVAWHSLSNCAYLLKSGGRPFIERLLRLVEVAPVGTTEARRALSLPMPDLEDAFQSAAALAWSADVIVTEISTTIGTRRCQPWPQRSFCVVCGCRDRTAPKRRVSMVWRARLRAEIDAQVAHLSALTAPEFTDILTTFHLVPAPVKAAAVVAFRAPPTLLCGS